MQVHDFSDLERGSTNQAFEKTGYTKLFRETLHQIAIGKQINRRSLFDINQFPIRIQFIGRQGRILSDVTTPTASYTFKGDEGYVRAKVLESNGRVAWIQPVPVGASGPK